MVNASGFAQVRHVAQPGSAQILLVRHGETEPYTGEPFPTIEDGTGDPQLTDEGHAGAARVAQRLAPLPIASVYVTPLRRTHQTAAPLLAATGHEPVVVADLQEIHLGEWDRGVSREHFANGHPIARRVKEELSWDHIPGCEGDEAFGRRVRRGVEFIAQRHPDEVAVAFTHGGVISEIVRQAADSRRFAFPIDNASVTHLVVADDGWKILTLNDVSHRWPLVGDQLD